MTDERRTRLYSETEIGALIKRASELQERARIEPERGVSLQDLERIAEEVGIEPVHLRTAAAELSRGIGKGLLLWGGPFVLQDRRLVSASVTPDQWTGIVDGLRGTTGSEGRTSQIGRSQEWTREIQDLDFVLERTRITIHPGENRTTIEVRKEHRGGALLAYGLGAILGGGAAGVFLDGSLLSDLVNGVILAGGSVGGLAAARGAVGYWTKRQRQELTKLTNWLTEFLSHAEAEGEAEGSLPQAAAGGWVE